MIGRFFTILLYVALTLPSASFVSAQVGDGEPPEINNVQVEQVDDTTLRVSWETDEDADSLVNYGLQPDYGIVRIPEANRTVHSVTLDNLEAGRVYHFRVVSADSDGNQGISADYKITTSGTPTESGTGEGVDIGPGQVNDVTTQEIIEQIKQIQDPQEIKEIQNEIVKAVQGITEDLTIVGPPTVTPETTTALVEWTTDRPASSEVLFTPSSQYSPGVYAFQQSSTGGETSNHSIRLIGLESFTDYNFKVRSTDEFGITGESLDFTFQTKASLPEIRNLRIVKVEENAATLAWDTTVPAKALIEYQDMTTGVQNSKGRPTLATSHQMRISDLTLGARYVAFVIAENGGGDRVRSQPITFVTVRDTAPPIISNVTNESTLFPGSESRIQSIVEWRTDEPSSCLMTYREGVAGGVEPTTIEQEQVNFTERHVEVITDFAPATVYQFWLNCTDETGNTVQSENFVLFTPIQEKNIIDLILENFESTFGWVGNIGA